MYGKDCAWLRLRQHIKALEPLWGIMGGQACQPNRKADPTHQLPHLRPATCPSFLDLGQPCITGAGRLIDRPVQAAVTKSADPDDSAAAWELGPRSPITSHHRARQGARQRKTELGVPTYLHFLYPPN
ncbi:hypothetical protein AOLI_G00191540 [Acnodon oligacanthus]